MILLNINGFVKYGCMYSFFLSCSWLYFVKQYLHFCAKISNVKTSCVTHAYIMILLLPLQSCAVFTCITVCSGVSQKLFNLILKLAISPPGVKWAGLNREWPSITFLWVHSAHNKTWPPLLSVTRKLCILSKTVASQTNILTTFAITHSHEAINCLILCLVIVKQIN